MARNNHVDAGGAAPDFKLPRDGGDFTQLSDYDGSFLVLYFYPKDDTAGCTKQAIAFSEKKSAFSRAGAKILGVSKDTVAKHEKFIDKHDLSITLGSDENGDVVAAYGVWVEKSMYGRKFMGIERTTFLIGPGREILKVWRKVKVAGHVEEVLDAVKAAKKAA